MTQVQKREENLPAPSWDDVSYEPDDIEGVNPTFPEIKLVQKAVERIPDSGRHGGDFWLSDTGEFRSTVDGVFIRAQSIRGLWSKEDMKRPVCSSLDARKPIPGGRLWEMEEVETRDGVYEVIHAEPALCASCAFSMWRDGKCPCPISYITLFEFEDGRLYRWRWKGSAARPMSKLINDLAGMGARRGAKGIGRPIFSKQVHVYSEPAKNDKFNWYAPLIDVMGDVDPTLGPEYAALSQEVGARWKAAVEATHDEADEEAAPADDGWESA